MDDIDFDNVPQLMAVGRLTRLIPSLAWFSRMGEPADRPTGELAFRFVSDFGFPDAHVLWHVDPADAAEALEIADTNSPAWEVMEQFRSALTDEAVAGLGEDAVDVALTHIRAVASEVCTNALGDAADKLGLHDQAFLQALVGQAIQASHMSALLLLAEADEDHPVSPFFHLFEAGRAPLALIGQTFHIY
ncbi:MAG: hypothetical protein AAGF15_07190 [Pseudomonadota bacterium]